MKTNQSNFLQHLERLAAHAAEFGEPVGAEFDLFDEFLDELAANDYFGTERQCDPRGDGRDARRRRKGGAK